MSVNGVYFDKTNFNSAYKTLLQTNDDFCIISPTLSSSPSSFIHQSALSFNCCTQIKRFELLVSRNLSVSVVNKAVAPESFSSSSPPSLSNNNNQSSCILTENRTASCFSSQQLLIYDLNNDCLLQQKTRETTPTTATNIIPNTNEQEFINKYKRKEEKEEEEETLSPNYFYHHSSKLVNFSITMVLNTEWTQLEIIELLNETLSSVSFSSPPTTLNTTATSGNSNKKIGTNGAAAAVASQPPPPPPFALKFASSVSGGSGVGGFGFGITGNKSTGVVVKAVTPGGSAFRVIIFDIFIY